MFLAMRVATRRRQRQGGGDDVAVMSKAVAAGSARLDMQGDGGGCMRSPAFSGFARRHWRLLGVSRGWRGNGRLRVVLLLSTRR